MIRRPPRSTLFPTRRSSDLTPFVFAERLQGTRAAIKKAIMDQRRVAGVGNIYANEALFEAGIDPSKGTNKLSLDEFARDRKSTRLKSSHGYISYAVFFLKKKKKT